MATTTRRVLENVQNAEIKPKVDNQANKKLLRVAWDMWQHQNEVLHENQDNQPRILEMEMNQLVSALYTLGPSAFDHGNTLL